MFHLVHYLSLVFSFCFVWHQEKLVAASTAPAVLPELWKWSGFASGVRDFQKVLDYCLALFRRYIRGECRIAITGEIEPSFREEIR